MHDLHVARVTLLEEVGASRQVENLTIDVILKVGPCIDATRSAFTNWYNVQSALNLECFFKEFEHLLNIRSWHQVERSATIDDGDLILLDPLITIYVEGHLVHWKPPVLRITIHIMPFNRPGRVNFIIEASERDLGLLITRCNGHGENGVADSATLLHLLNEKIGISLVMAWAESDEAGCLEHTEAILMHHIKKMEVGNAMLIIIIIETHLILRHDTGAASRTIHECE